MSRDKKRNKKNIIKEKKMKKKINENKKQFHNS